MRALIYLLALGLIGFSIFSWIYELTPSGLKKTEDVGLDDSISHKTSQRLNRIIIVALLIVVLLLLINTFFFKGYRDQPNEDEKTALYDSNKPSIAVLAFKDLSPGKDQAYFSDGISESILNLLTRIPGLKVISSTSSFYYKDKNESLQNISEALGTRYILDGTVQKSQSKLRITTKLVDAKDGSQIWDNTFDKQPTDIFEIQDEIASSIADQLKLTFAENRLHSNSIDLEAYQFFLRASYVFNASSPDELSSAEGLVRNSIAIDSLYAPSWVLLNKILTRRYRNYDQIEEELGRRLANEAIFKALEKDPKNAEALATLALSKAYLGELDGIDSLFQKSQQLGPSDPDILSLGADIHRHIGKLDEALALDQKAYSLDPLSPEHLFSIGVNYYYKKDFESALEKITEYVKLRPKAGLSHMFLSICHYNLGNYELALAEAEKETFEVFNLLARIFAYHGLGDSSKTEILLNDFINDFPDESEHIIALVYAIKNDNEKAFDWLDKAFERDSFGLHHSLQYPNFYPLYDDPRWTELIQKINLPEGHWLLEELEN